MAKKTYKKKVYKKKSQANNNQVTVWSHHSALDKATRALALVNNVRRFINVEVKHHDVSYTAGALSTAGQVFNLCNPAQGDTLNQRDGISIKPLHLSIRGSFRGNGSDTTANRIRVIIFRGKQENGVSFTTTDLLETASVYSFKNYTDRFRTKILHDKIYIPTAKAGTATEHPTCEFNINEKLFGHINFVESASTIENGGLYMLVLMDSGINTSYMTANIRTSFTDN